MTQLCLVRHGQTHWNLERRWQGHIDLPLNQTGLNQAELLARDLASTPFTGDYSSDLQRAFVTAQTLARVHNLPVRTDSGLREQNMGEWEGKIMSEIPSLYPEDWAARQQTPISFQAKGGESIIQLSQRVISVVRSICNENKAGSSLLIVSHGLAIAVIICHIQGFPLEDVFQHVPQNATPLFLDWPA